MAGVASTAFGLAQMIFAAVRNKSLSSREERELIHSYVQVSLSKDGEFVATKWQIYLLYLAILFVHGMLNVRDPPSHDCCFLLSFPLTTATLTRSRSAPKCSPR